MAGKKDEALDYLFERYADRRLTIKISIEEGKRELKSNIPIEDLKTLTKSFGIPNAIGTIIDPLFRVFVEAHYNEKKQGENPVVPDILEIMDDLDNKAEENSDD